MLRHEKNLKRNDGYDMGGREVSLNVRFVREPNETNQNIT